MNYLLFVFICLVVVLVSAVVYLNMIINRKYKNLYNYITQYHDSIVKQINRTCEQTSGDRIDICTLEKEYVNINTKFAKIDERLATIREDQKIQNHTLTRIETNTIHSEDSKFIPNAPEQKTTKKTTRTKKA